MRKSADVLAALEQAAYDGHPSQSDSLVHHSDRRSQHVSICYPECLGEALVCSYQDVRVVEEMLLQIAGIIGYEITESSM